jgi:hypothetical protein
LFLAAWAAAAVALIAAVMKRARRWWSKEDQDEPEPIQAESNNPKSFSQDEKFSNLDSAGKRKRKSRKIIFSIETIRDEGDD